MSDRARAVAAVAVALVLLAAATLAWDRYRGRDLPTGEARWLWADGVESGKPLAFVAAVDFEVESVPARAELRLTVDPEYEVWINGSWIGAGRWELGRDHDAWAVADRLQAGPNRLAIVARAPYGVGGLIAALVADPRTSRQRWLTVSDRRWRVYGRRPAGILEGWAPLDADHVEPAAPIVWGRPPIGRWGRLDLGAVRPAELVPDEGTWGREVAAVPTDDDERSVWLIDFGEVATGWIDLWGGPTPETRASWRAAETLEGLAEAPPSGWVVPLRGDERWRSPAPRRLRYLWVESQRPPRSARVLASGVSVPLDSPVEDLRRARDGLWRLEPSGAEPR